MRIGDSGFKYKKLGDEKYKKMKIFTCKNI